MPTKKELEKQVQVQTELLDDIKKEVKELKEDWEKFSGFLGTLGYTLQEIYRCYPHIIGEVCTEKELIRIFRVQSELTEFIRKIQKMKQDENEESGFGEI